MEFGTTTGRKRRCGWLDVVALRRAVVTNSLSALCLTKLDVLDGFGSLNICVGYRTADHSTKFFPQHAICKIITQLLSMSFLLSTI